MQRGRVAAGEEYGAAPEETRLQAAFLANRPRLARFLRARCGSDDVEDLLQDLWLKAQAAPPSEVEEPLAYLFRAAHRLVLDRRRGASRRTEREAAWQVAHDGPQAAEPAGAERRLIAREAVISAAQVLASLGPRAEQVFRRARLDGDSQASIAADLGVSLSTVEKDLKKAYAALLLHRRRSDVD